ncbi:glutamine synthetase III [Parafannyhessea umbonata]|jgi:glutamine synthetase|uniref:glutamine synthetase III family protein n=1 Tax=Parafannyhessea TaxID=2847312 RepID=UPI0015682362|nr:glutamine synthetase III [Parafannyhessea umbonata]MDD6360142.1 glutamine synthetase III [Parafannyhessea umbonata]MDD6566447.1 glutamine synthetase III [Parafannyhessea umbonata]MDD6601419.1 glutamine synthetase III [Parafannyhessea umbonata]MDD7198840.1 glutamine synthetase III [Parafannyhessea umbonata]MDY4418242.1 glutamine synthetase III [Parafannyhessea umbonata]
MSKDKVTEEYGSLVFTDQDMQERLPKPTYKELRRVIDEGKELNLDIANEVAHAMKDWALEHGATHFTHWFQPLTGITSEKHDSFINPNGDGTVLMAFSGKELVQGEPDASSFPSGGLRATFEARGYTVWDPMSPAFIKDEVLCIPTAFISYTGEALDKKTPLLRSEVALEKQAKRVLGLFGKKPSRVYTTIGPEQEYFIITEDDYKARPDLVLTGRTLFGAEPAKGQELEEHYFGTIRPSVNAFMKEVDDELWKLAVPLKTKHNEVAPCQHEFAPIFEKGSLAIDDNLLTMEKLKLLATHHGFACLEHEKPFEYVNGSGKHNNWSVSADNENLLEPGDDPQDNLQFLVFLAFLVAAVDDHADLLRASVASAGNDHRLGANEAPPAIISVFLGDALTPIVDALIKKEQPEAHDRARMDLGVPALPNVLRDNTDRNRTSPFAFTGNKFEFRMCGSQQNLSDPNVVLNTAVAEQCERFVSYIDEHADEDFTTAAMRFVRHTFRDHERILFDGNGYSEEWEKEAERRGLPNLKSTPDAIPSIVKPENIAFFEKYGVLSEAETRARYVAKAEQYAKLLNIEANTMVNMARTMYLPAISAYAGDLATSVATRAEIGVDAAADKATVKALSEGSAAILAATDELEAANAKARELDDVAAEDNAYRDEVLPLMDKLRAAVDAMETVTSKDYWPVPSYNDMLFYV